MGYVILTKSFIMATSDQQKIKILLDKINALQANQQQMAAEMLELKKEITAEWYRQTIATKDREDVLIDDTESESLIDEQHGDPVSENSTAAYIDEEEISDDKSLIDKILPTSILTRFTSKEEQNTEEIENDEEERIFNWEKFIGENLINKIGILIIIIGVGIGAKYSIENNLISPLTRVILGYLTGVVLLATGIKLKDNYHNYSAVLVSGAMTIMFFITFTAYSFYNLFPLIIAFGLMVLFTIFTVVAAIIYDKQVISHIGLVGAYAVPFLLSSGSGDVSVLMSYVAIINVGILVISFIKDWKSLNYVAFVFTWLIYASWILVNYDSDSQFTLAATFASIYFLTFYMALLAYKVMKQSDLKIMDVVLILVNAFVFYAVGYYLLDLLDDGTQYLGLFTLANAIIHFIVAIYIYNRKLANKNLYYLLAVLVLTFITIAIPVQLEGDWVTLLWTIEAALLFWIGRSKDNHVFEYISYPIILLAFVSVMGIHSTKYYYLPYQEDYEAFTSIFNIHFLTNVLFLIAIAFIIYTHHHKKYQSTTNNLWLSKNFLTIVFWGIGLFVLYIAFKSEIEYFFDKLYHQSAGLGSMSSDFSTAKNVNYLSYKSVWVANFTMLYLTILSYVNINYIKSKLFGRIQIGINFLVILSFLVVGLYVLSQLRHKYLVGDSYGGFDQSYSQIYIRFISIGFLSALVYITYIYQRQPFIKWSTTKVANVIVSIILLWILTSGYLHWSDMMGVESNYKLGLSILWGLFSLVLVSYGIWKNKKHLRVTAIIVFAVTLVKLFIYDIADQDTISKTIVFVSLGVLLLIISFLYNKYTSRITHEEL